MTSGKVKTGLDQVAAKWPKVLRGARIGLVVHPASVDRRLRHAASVCLESREFRLKAFFGPQHGIRGETQDNMIEWEGSRDLGNGLPVFSLYGKTRRPTPEMLRGLDALVIDLQDVGARYYTFIWTMALIMQACRETGKAVVVLDRPNPIGGKLTEGPVLAPEYSSFVGLHPLPVRHGMTIGEIALYLQTLYPGVHVHVIRMMGWARRMWFDAAGLPWVLPSPNMPTVETAAVYPGMCLLEGTNLSEGRGTTRPFEIFGAPFIEPDRLVDRLSGFGLRGVVFRPLYFLPTFQKHAGTLCGGAQIHVTDRIRFKPFKTAVGIIKAVFDLYPKDFSWKNPPYEYEKRLMPIDILAGTDRVRKDIEAGRDLDEMELWWNEELRAFDREIRMKTLLYT
ncbi:MAG: exo-beta-N-acetylmuramidase NamZ domain-containing protein [Acidobacteriota bacterium]